MIPSQLVVHCRKTAERQRWLDALPVLVEELATLWSLRVGAPFAHSGTCAWVAPAFRTDGTPTILKLGMPHMEGAQEIEGLRFWSGTPTVRVLEADDGRGAMLLERCVPGTALRSEPESEQDAVIARLVGKLHRTQGFAEPGRFRPLAEMLRFWQEETLAQEAFWPDRALVRDGLAVWQNLGRPSAQDVLLATDLHAGNVLRAQREPWIVIDPKPFRGDPAFDLVQHLMNCEARLHRDPRGLIRRVADLAQVDEEHLRLWTFSRAAADPREDWKNRLWVEIAKSLSR